MSCGRTITSLLLVCGAWTAPAVAQKPQELPVLARSVPPDARLLLEVTDVQTFLKSRAGQEFIDLLTGLMPTPTTRPSTQPVSNWQQVLGEKLGLDGRAAGLLLSGRIALAADGWSQIDE